MTHSSDARRWSLSAFVLIVALLFSVVALRSFAATLVLLAVVAVILAIVHFAGRRR